MKIEKTRVRSSKGYIPPSVSKFRIKSPDITDGHKAKLGVKSFNDGDSFVPGISGPITRFNAEGRPIILKDQPKEYRLVMQREWSWEDWGGHTHSTIVDIRRMCYPRDYLFPPEKEIIFQDGHFYSEIINSSDTNNALHIINLFLEIFGECEIVNEDYKSFPHVKRLNFEILPPGEYPFDRLKEYLKTKKRGHASYAIVEDRFKFFEDKKPDVCLMGVNGLHGYVGYKFGENIVFDNTTYGNAIYVLKSTAEEFCNLTKKDILTRNLHLARIIHDEGWKKAVTPYVSTKV